MSRRRPPQSRQPAQLSLVPEDPSASSAPEGEDSHGSARNRPLELPQLLTAADLATVLKVTTAAVYALVARGHIPKECVHWVGRLLRFKATEVDAWISKGSRGTGGVP